MDEYERPPTAATEYKCQFGYYAKVLKGQLTSSSRLGGNALDAGDIGRGHVFLVCGVAKTTSLSVISTVKEVHSGVCGLRLVVTPVVKNVTSSRVDIHEPPNLGEAVVDADVVLGLRLRCGGSAVKSLRAGRGGSRRGGGVEELLEVPEEIKVTVEIDTDRCAACAGTSVSVLAPEGARGLIVGNSVRVDEREEDDTGSENALDLGVGVCLPAVCETGSGLVGSKQVGDPVNELIGTTSLTGVHASTEVELVLRLVRTSTNVSSGLCSTLESLVWQSKGVDAITVNETLDCRVDLGRVHDGADC